MEKTIEKICEYCHQLFHIIPSRIKHGRGKHCSPECQYAAIAKRPKKNSVQLNCLNCDKPFAIYKSWLKSHKGGGKYCSRKCRDTHRIGENHPQFIDGNGVNNHGANWYAQRRKALKRDNQTCQICETTKSESIKEYGQPLAVHHKIPYRDFEGNYKKANKLSNLITLCHSCHRQADIEIQRKRRGHNT